MTSDLRDPATLPVCGRKPHAFCKVGCLRPPGHRNGCQCVHMDAPKAARK